MCGVYACLTFEHTSKPGLPTGRSGKSSCPSYIGCVGTQHPISWILRKGFWRPPWAFGRLVAYTSRQSEKSAVARYSVPNPLLESEALGTATSPFESRDVRRAYAIPAAVLTALSARRAVFPCACQASYGALDGQQLLNVSQ